MAKRKQINTFDRGADACAAVILTKNFCVCSFSVFFFLSVCLGKRESREHHERHITSAREEFYVALKRKVNVRMCVGIYADIARPRVQLGAKVI